MAVGGMIRAFLALLLLIGAAGAAQAQARAGYRIPPAPRAAPARPAPPVSPARPIRSVRPTASVSSISGPAQCRNLCARTRYQCPSDGDNFDCASSWSQCVARCR